MTRSELIAELAASNPHLKPTDVELIVDKIFEQITDRWHAAAASSCVVSAPSG